LPSGSRVFVGSNELVNEACDEKRFVKRPGGALYEVRNGIGDGLFTAFPEEENWGIAHRVLMPMFGPLAIKGMFEEMHEMAVQLVSLWARRGPENKIAVTEDFTKLTLDSIAVCAMDTRFNSFYRDELHPFVTSMQFFLKESGMRALRPSFVSDYVYRQSTKQYWDSIELMKSVARHVIDERRAHPQDKKDLVNAMLDGEDPKTGKKMSDESIMNNMITFLIAGHETTSGLLSFLFMSFLQNPRALKAAQKEVDEVIGKGPILYEHMNKLPYITACIREVLRLYPTAPAFEVTPVSTKDDEFPITIGKEKFEINKEDHVIMLLPSAHIDPVVYGEDAKDFKPERMLDANFNALPPNAWKPFGNGARACIGRAFAWQEAHIAVAMLLQNFNFRADDPSYKLKIVQTLTIKPGDFYMYASLREGLDPISLERRLWNGTQPHKVDSRDKKVEEAALSAIKRKPMAIYYGSNTGTCEALAQMLANTASTRGYDPVVKPLDAATDSVPTDQPFVVITASYEGEPPDNACHFMEWLKSLEGNKLKGAKHAVFGCGHRDWQSTFQKIPTLTDELLTARGSTQLTKRGYADAADNDIFNGEYPIWLITTTMLT
jgi:cytochrome P450/NADPH-cytochrome P450 reductase